jgi:dextranase
MKEHLTYIDCYPDKAQYLVGETVGILLEAESRENIIEIVFTVSDLARVIYSKPVNPSELMPGPIVYRMTCKLPVGNYGVDVKVIYHNAIYQAHTACDVVESYDSMIRYGFLADFSEQDKDDTSDINYALKLHLNALQFYDWMYRHDKLVAEEEEYLEPLGRKLSLQTIRNKINLCKQHGIRPFAYGAVYAASKEAYAEHPSWALYKKNKEVLSFAEWLVFMDTTNDSSWCRYIIEQYADSIKRLGFQGIHMDTYGFPKYVYNDRQERISLAETFPGMIKLARQAVKEIDDKAGVIFNAVNNWPVEVVAGSEQDAVYIEVWPPHVTYQHLYTLIREAKYLGAKQVILAAYMKPFMEAKTEEEIRSAEYSLLLTNAVIQASGGSQLVFGETNSVLCDSYYVNYAKLREEFIPKVRSYCDFTVRYGKLIYDRNAMDISMTAANGINEDIVFTSPKDSKVLFSSNGSEGKIWTIIREAKNSLTIHMINLIAVNDQWNEPKVMQPLTISGVEVDILLDTEIKGAYMATPDDGTGIPIRLEYRLEQKSNGQHLVITIPKLEIWNMIWIEHS